MLKYVDTLIGFSEVPDEISLCINISNCPCHCLNCHSAYLAEDIGEVLDKKSLEKLIYKNKGITCVCFLGGDVAPIEILELAAFIKDNYPDLKVAWYSGKEELPKDIKDNLQPFNYIKLGSYREELGPLNNRNTNQRFYVIFPNSTGICELIDITYKFWKND